MASPIYDCAVRTSVVASGGALVQLVPPAAALGTGRIPRLRQISISNTTATAFGVGLGQATAAAVTPATAGTILRRTPTTGATDPASVCSVWTTFATTPTAPSAYNVRLFVPASSTVIWVWNEGEELQVPPAATPLPFCIFNTGTGQIADVTLSWTE